MKKLLVALSVFASFSAFAGTHTTTQINYNDADLISPTEVATHGNPHDPSYKPVAQSRVEKKTESTVAYDFISADEKNPHNK